jgi:hypothetical protein
VKPILSHILYVESKNGVELWNLSFRLYFIQTVMFLKYDSRFCVTVTDLRFSKTLPWNPGVEKRATFELPTQSCLKTFFLLCLTRESYAGIEKSSWVNIYQIFFELIIVIVTQIGTSANLNGSIGSIAHLIPKDLGFESRVKQGYIWIEIASCHWGVWL